MLSSEGAPDTGVSRRGTDGLLSCGSFSKAQDFLSIGVQAALVGFSKNPDAPGEKQMSTHDEARRSFLIGAVVGAGAAGFVSDASGQEKGQQNKPADVAPSSRTSSNSDERGAFFNAEDAQTVSAFAERLMPGAPGKPGAREAGVLNYIDLALAGAYADQQDFYRRGLAALSRQSRGRIVRLRSCSMALGASRLLPNQFWKSIRAMKW